MSSLVFLDKQSQYLPPILTHCSFKALLGGRRGAPVLRSTLTPLSKRFLHLTYASATIETYFANGIVSGSIPFALKQKEALRTGSSGNDTTESQSAELTQCITFKVSESELIAVENYCKQNHTTKTEWLRNWSVICQLMLIYLILATLAETNRPILNIKTVK